MRYPNSSMPAGAVSRDEAESPQSRCTLWIGGPSPELRERLVRTRELGSSVIIQFEHPSDEDRLSTQFLTLVSKTVRHRSIHQVIVCYEPNDVPGSSVKTPSPVVENSSRAYHILERCRAKIERLDRLKNRVLVQLHQVLTSVPMPPPTHCFGMCYLPESDAFLVHDPAVNQFIPVTEATRRPR